MLVLTRKLGEIIRVGESVTVRVLEVKGHQVRLGIDAPPEVRIYREEIYRAISKEHEGTAPDEPSRLEASAGRWNGERGKH